MLKIIERELVWNIYIAKRVLNKFKGVSHPFAKAEPSGTNLSGKWDETIFGTSDVNAY